MLGASRRGRRGRFFGGQRAARAGKDRGADAADPNAFGPDAAKAEGALASTGCSATAGSRAERGATSGRYAGAAKREAFARAVRRRRAFTAASAASCRYEPTAAGPSTRAARKDARVRRGMGQDEAGVERGLADVARFRDGMSDALSASPPGGNECATVKIRCTMKAIARDASLSTLAPGDECVKRSRNDAKRTIAHAKALRLTCPQAIQAEKASSPFEERAFSR